MTAKSLLDLAINLLGYAYDDDMHRPALAYINQVCTDLSLAGGIELKEVETLTDKLTLPEWILRDVAVYGLAMWLALYRGDGERNQFFAQMYSQKRQKMTRSVSRKDVLPTTEG